MQQMTNNHTALTETLTQVLNANQAVLEKITAVYDGDDEGPFGGSELRQRRKTKKIKLHDVPKPRPAAVNQLHVYFNYFPGLSLYHAHSSLLGAFTEVHGRPTQMP